jgi:hypothetical protein
MEAIAAGALYIGLDTRITEHGRPVEGAQVTLVPEPFMGQACPKFFGTSGPGGYCPTKSEGAELLGAPPPASTEPKSPSPAPARRWRRVWRSHPT